MPTKKSTSRKTKKKVPEVQKGVSVVVLHCPNCGEEDEKVFYCSECDSPMEVSKVDEKKEDEVENDITLDKDKAGESTAEEPDEEDDVTGADDRDVKKVIETGGLDDIFSEGGGGPETSADSEDDSEDEVTLEDALNTLEDE